VTVFAAIRNDARLQRRHGIWAVAALMVVAYVVPMVFLPSGVQRWILPVVIFSDPAIGVFFFAAALLLFERQDGVLEALAVTPMPERDYLVSKAVSLAVVALATSAAVAVGVRRAEFDFLWLAAGVVPTASLFVWLGIVAATRLETVNRVIVGGGIGVTVLSAPAVAFLAGLNSWWLGILPTYGSVRLIARAFAQPLGTGAATFAVFWLLAANALAYEAAKRSLKRYAQSR
jgi:fluoroquinolone transport system permease protein